MITPTPGSSPSHFPQAHARDEWHHLCELVLFALAMQETLKEFNKRSSNNFQLRVGKPVSKTDLDQQGPT